MIKKRLLPLIILIYTGLSILNSTITLANEEKFELKELIIKEKEDESDRPLFDLINNENMNSNLNKNTTDWGNNPFFKDPTPVVKTPEPVASEPEPTTLNLFEFKVTAVWMINDKFKVLISGHILEEGDELNNVKIKKITQKEITVEKNKTSKKFRLGSIFYDFQI